MNETAARLAGKEIGSMVIERFYPEKVPPPPAPPDETDNGEPASTTSF